MGKDITAVVGLYTVTPEQLKRSIDFIENFTKRFSDIPLSISCVGSSKEHQEELKNRYGERIIVGTDKRVAFSETWNYAILGVKTSKFVFLHNDMFLDPDFFEELDRYLDQDSQGFYVYSTVEPLKNAGWPRLGKYVADFGEDFDNFKEEKFFKFANTLKGRKAGRGYGFYLAGFTENLKKVGGFDHETYFPIFCEDDDLMVRIRKAGYKTYTAPGAVVYHFGSKTIREITTKSMSDSEIEMNRRFARKWGFEARYLWETGYEFGDTVFETGTEKIGFEISKDVSVPLMDAVNVEPLVDKLNVNAPEFDNYLQSNNVLYKKGSLDDCDIIITQVGPGNFETITYLIGDLRIEYKKLTPGSRKIENYIVTVRRLHKDLNRIDSKNYLSLLQNDQQIHE